MPRSTPITSFPDAPRAAVVLQQFAVMFEYTVVSTYSCKAEAQAGQSPSDTCSRQLRRNRCLQRMQGSGSPEESCITSKCRESLP